MYRYTERRRRFVFGGNEVFSFFTSYPVFETYEKINSFYSLLADRCENWCESEGALRAQEALSTAPTNQKYLFQKYFLSFNSKVSYISSKIICVKTDVSISRGKKESILQTSDALVWEISSENILPPKYALSILKKELAIEKIKRPTKYTSVATDGENLLMLKNGIWSSISSGHTSP